LIDAIFLRNNKLKKKDLFTEKLEKGRKSHNSYFFQEVKFINKNIFIMEQYNCYMGKLSNKQSE